MIVIETERLTLRRFHAFDGEAMDRVFGEAEVMLEGYSHPDHVYSILNPGRG